MVIVGQEKWQKDPLCESLPLLYMEDRPIAMIIEESDHDMSFVVGKLIVGIDDANGICELEFIFHPLTAARRKDEHDI